MSSYVYLYARDYLDPQWKILLRECKKKYGLNTDFRNVNMLLVQYGMYHGFGNKSEVAVNKDRNGAPFIVGSNEYVSLSHGKEITGCALSDSPIGIDIQELIEYKEGFFEFLLSEYEKEQFHNVTDKNDFITIMWSLKESYGKLKRLGMNYKFSKTRFQAVLNEELQYEEWLYRSELLNGSVISCFSNDTCEFEIVETGDLLSFIKLL